MKSKQIHFSVGLEDETEISAAAVEALGKAEELWRGGKAFGHVRDEGIQIATPKLVWLTGA